MVSNLTVLKRCLGLEALMNAGEFLKEATSGGRRNKKVDSLLGGFNNGTRTCGLARVKYT